MLEGLTPHTNRAYRCKVADFKNSLEANDYEILLQALADTETWSANALMKALRSRGVILTDGVIHKHRNKQCRCFRD